jgi:hypothetical protein
MLNLTICEYSRTQDMKSKQAETQKNQLVFRFKCQIFKFQRVVFFEKNV